MTILSGEPYRVETLSQFMNRLDVNYKEIITATDQISADELLTEFNEEIAAADDLEQATSLDDLDNDYLSEWVTAHLRTYNAIVNVLRARDRNYIHLYYDPLHHIVELSHNQPQDVN